MANHTVGDAALGANEYLCNINIARLMTDNYRYVPMYAQCTRKRRILILCAVQIHFLSYTRTHAIGAVD